MKRGTKIAITSLGLAATVPALVLAATFVSADEGEKITQEECRCEDKGFGPSEEMGEGFGRGMRRGMMKGMGMFHGERMKEDLAEFLGMTVEDLEQAKEDGLRMPDLLDQAGKTELDLADFKYARLENELSEEVEDGDITEEEKAEILEKAKERQTRRLERIEEKMNDDDQADIEENNA